MSAVEILDAARAISRASGPEAGAAYLEAAGFPRELALLALVGRLRAEREHGVRIRGVRANRKG